MLLLLLQQGSESLLCSLEVGSISEVFRCYLPDNEQKYSATLQTILFQIQNFSTTEFEKNLENFTELNYNI